MYTNDTGPLDMNDNVIKEDNRIVVGSNKGLRVGKVVGVKSYEYDDYLGNTLGYEYNVTVHLDTGKNQTFSHGTMGASKFWVITE